jgi:hypothetical protein
MLSSWIQLKKLTITIKSILLFQSIKKVPPSCNIVICQVPIVDSLRWNSDRRFLQLLFFPVFPHTFPSFFSRYNRENLQSGTSYFHISKKYFPLPPCVVRIVMENTIHSLVFFDGGSALLPSGSGWLKKVGGGNH